jgi:hypothetical protein
MHKHAEIFLHFFLHFFSALVSGQRSVWVGDWRSIVREYEPIRSIAIHGKRFA